MSPRTRDRWDLFCRVVDNYGDIGIAWRLARQLAVDETRDVRLVVDRLDVFARIESRIDPARERQVVDGIAVVDLAACERAVVDLPAVVVELLGCGLPSGYVDEMARSAASRAPVWIDFEHLSAEAWVPGFHGLPSPHPTLPLTKQFFYPGFGDDTGGLLIEPGLDERRRAFLASPDAIAASWRRLGLSAPETGESRLVLFAYPDSPIRPLLEALAEHGRWTVLVPGGPDEQIVGSSRVHPIPFVGQDDFDRLLWSCDAAFVRGEDSFVRAQVAGRPFVWQIYRQADDVHLTKLHAFETIHEAGMPPEAAAAQRRMVAAWNEKPGDVKDAARDWLAAWPALQHHAGTWRERLMREAPLVQRLVAFVEARRAARRHSLAERALRRDLRHHGGHDVLEPADRESPARLHEVGVEARLRLARQHGRNAHLGRLHDGGRRLRDVRVHRGQ